MHLSPLNIELTILEQCLGGRSKAVHELASRLNVTVSTLYSWIGSDDHFIFEDEDDLKVFKMVKHIEE